MTKNVQNIYKQRPLIIISKLLTIINNNINISKRNELSLPITKID